MHKYYFELKREGKRNNKLSRTLYPTSMLVGCLNLSIIQQTTIKTKSKGKKKLSENIVIPITR